MNTYPIIFFSFLLLTSFPVTQANNQDEVFVEEQDEALVEFEEIDQEQIEEYARREVAFQVALEKQLYEVLREFNIKFYREYHDEITRLRTSYNPALDSQRVHDFWHAFLDRNLEQMVQVAEPIFNQIAQDVGEGNPSVSIFFRTMFRLKLREHVYALQEQFLIESTASQQV